MTHETTTGAQYLGNATIGKKKPRHIEDDMCMELCKLIKQHIAAGNAPNLITFYHTPNGGKRGKAAAGRFKAMGVLAGVPDYTFLYTRHIRDFRASLNNRRPPEFFYPSVAYLEMKAPGGRQSPSQKDFDNLCLDNGILYDLAYSVAEAVEWLEMHGIIGGGK